MINRAAKVVFRNAEKTLHPCRDDGDRDLEVLPGGLYRVLQIETSRH
jgi:hypothetical protein